MATFDDPEVIAFDAPPALRRLIVAFCPGRFRGIKPKPAWSETNQLWELRGSEGRLLIKQIPIRNPRHTLLPTQREEVLVPNLRRQQALQERAAAAGLHVARPARTRKGELLVVDNWLPTGTQSAALLHSISGPGGKAQAAYIAHHPVPGHAIAARHRDQMPAVAFAAGVVDAEIAYTGTTIGRWTTWPDQGVNYWQGLLAEARRLDMPFVGELERRIPDFVALEPRMNLVDDGPDRVHQGDLVPANLIFNKGTFRVIDFEYCGPTPSATEFPHPDELQGQLSVRNGPENFAREVRDHLPFGSNDSWRARNELYDRLIESFIAGREWRWSEVAHFVAPALPDELDGQLAATRQLITDTLASQDRDAVSATSAALAQLSDIITREQPAIAAEVSPAVLTTDLDSVVNDMIKGRGPDDPLGAVPSAPPGSYPPIPGLNAAEEDPTDLEEPLDLDARRHSRIVDTVTRVDPVDRAGHQRDQALTPKRILQEVAEDDVVADRLAPLTPEETSADTLSPM